MRDALRIKIGTIIVDDTIREAFASRIGQEGKASALTVRAALLAAINAEIECVVAEFLAEESEEDHD